MRKSLFSFLVLFPALLAAQNIDNSQYVKQYIRPGQTVADGVTAAQNACNPDTTIPCLIIFDPSLAKYVTGTLPTKCTQCQWLDYRVGPAYLPTAGGTLTGAVRGFQDKGSQLFNVVAYGAVGDGSTDDSTAINLAEQTCLAAGGGTIFFPPYHTFRIAHSFTLAPTGGTVAPNGNVCGVDNQGTIYVDGVGIAGISAPDGTRYTIANSITAGATSVTLTTAPPAGVGAGTRAFVCYNQPPTNTAECMDHTYVTLTGVSGDTISFTTPLARPMSTTNTPAFNRWVEFPAVLGGTSGHYLNLNLGSVTESTASIDSGGGSVWLNFVQYGNITASLTEPGWGFAIQFSDGVNVPSLVVPSAIQNGGFSSEGLCLEIGESSDINFGVFKCDHFSHRVASFEGGVRAIHFDNVSLLDDAGDTNGYFDGADDSTFTVETLHVLGTGSVFASSGGNLLAGGSGGWFSGKFTTIVDDTVAGIGIGVSGFGSLSDVTNFYVRNPASVAGAMGISGKLSNPVTVSLTCSVDLSQTAGTYCSIPQGVPRSLQIATEKGSGYYSLASFNFGGSNGANFASSLTSTGQMIDVSYPASLCWGVNCTKWIMVHPSASVLFVPNASESGNDLLEMRYSFWPANLITANLNTTSGSTTATVSSASNLLPGMYLLGNVNLPQEESIASISGTTLTLEFPASATASSVPTNFFSAGFGDDASSQGLSGEPYVSAAWNNLGDAMNPGTCGGPNVNVPGVSATSALIVTPAANPGAGLSWNVYMSGTNTVTVQICNFTAGAITPVSTVYNVRVVR